jgi:hypothetical protein
MHCILARLFLLLLLAGDWAWDPFHGHCLFTHDFGSTDAVLFTGPHQLGAHFRSAHEPGHYLVGDLTALPALGSAVCGAPLLRRPAAPLLTSDRVYALGSILR